MVAVGHPAGEQYVGADVDGRHDGRAGRHAGGFPP